MRSDAEKWVPIPKVTDWFGADQAWIEHLVSSGKVSSRTDRGTALIDLEGLGRWLHGRKDSVSKASQELKTLKEVGEALGLRGTPTSICRLILERLSRSLDSAGVVILKNTEGAFYPAASYRVANDLDMNLLEDMGAWTARTGETLVLDDPPWKQTDRGSIPHKRNSLAVPLGTDGASLGAIVLVRSPDVPFTDQEIAFVSVLASGTTLALESAIIQVSHEDRVAEMELVQRQMEAYAVDVRGTFDAEKERARQLVEALAELEQTYLATVSGLAVAVEAKDAYTAGHIVRVTRYGLMMMDSIAPDEARDPQYEYGFLLHDVGKLAVPDAVLGKDGPLTDEEWKVMRLHPETGGRILDEIPFLALAKEIVYSHHERWDGKGYPLGLKGDEILLGARVFPIADSFDAMTSDRPYRKAMSTQDALVEIRDGSGTQFWPEAVEAFLSISIEKLEEVRYGSTRWDPLRRV